MKEAKDRIEHQLKENRLLHEQLISANEKMTSMRDQGYFVKFLVEHFCTAIFLQTLILLICGNLSALILMP